jgi:Fe(3+) dicitrate transport protein
MTDAASAFAAGCAALSAVIRVAVDPLLNPESRTFLPAVAASVLIAALARVDLRPLATLTRWRHPSSIVDVQLLLTHQLLGALGAVPRLAAPFAIATALVRGLDRAVGAPPWLAEWPAWSVSALYTVALFLASDISRYLLHRAMHTWAPLWRFHQVHHSAEVLTPLTYHRVHPVERALYELRGAVVTGAVAGVAFWLARGQATEITLLGVNALGLAMNAISGNLRHSEVWLRFGPRVERWLLSPAQHQLHHAAEPALQQANYGTWLACWDRLAGSLRVAPAAPPAAYGLAPSDRNHHPDELLSALFHPFSGLGGRLASAAALLVALPAHAEEPNPNEPADEGVTVLVTRPRGGPRESGSAHVIGEADLQRHAYDDIGRVLTTVPGVYVRGEDGYGLRPNIGMRGANSERSAKVALLEDGLPLAPAPYAAPAAYYFPMPQRLVGVEVFKGPAAIRQGPQTIGGAVNVLTRAVPESNQSAIDVGYGSYQTLRAHAWAAVATPRAGVLVESSNLFTGGFKSVDGGGPSGFERQDVMIKGRWAPSTGGTVRALEAKLGWGRERSNETYLGLHADDFAASPLRRYRASADDEMRWQRLQADVTYKQSTDHLDFRAAIYGRRLHRVWAKVNGFAGDVDLHDLLQRPESPETAPYLAVLRGEADAASPAQQLRFGTNDRSYDALGTQWVVRHRARTRTIAHTLELGARAHLDVVDRLQTEDLRDVRRGALVPTDSPTAVLLDATSTATAIAAWAAEDAQLGPVAIQPGLRVEAVRTSQTPGDLAAAWTVAALPGLAMIAHPKPSVDVFAGVHRGFSPVSPGSPIGTRPETAWAYEAGARALRGDGAARAEVVGFLSDYDNITGQCTFSSGCTPDRIDQQFNGGAAWIVGAESLVSGRIQAGDHALGAEASWTVTHTAFRTGFVSEVPEFGAVVAGDALPYVPSHQAALQMFDHHPRFDASVTVRGRSGLRDVAGQGKLDPATDAPANVQVDLAGAWRATDRVSVYANVTNLLNTLTVESWRPFGARPTAPRQLTLGVRATP